jgi:hypothetical protein
MVTGRRSKLFFSFMDKLLSIYSHWKNKFREEASPVLDHTGVPLLQCKEI